jgi:hypothetical protein
VESTRSQNITVSWRRSAADSGGSGGGSGAAAREFPHPPQNFAVATLVNPHCRQASWSGVPQ